MTFSLVCLFVALVVCFADFARLTNLRRVSADAPVQLVRLNTRSDAGMVRIEITADGSFNDLAIEQFTRGRESVIRIRGARSLLRSSYSIDDTLAPGLRTVSGEHDGEPFVDVIITMGQGATIAQKRSFNRLVIGIASDFARLRRNAPSTNTTVAHARREQGQPRAVTISSAPVTDSIPSPSKNVYASNAEAMRHQQVAEDPKELLPAAPLVASTKPTPPIFRGRTIWSDFNVGRRPFSRLNLAGIKPLYLQTQNNALNASSASLPMFWESAPVKVDAPGSVPGVWVPGTTASRRDDVGGRVVGKGILRPSFLFAAEYDDNFFYRSTTGRKFGIFTFAPRLEYEVPGEERAVRVAYEPRLRRLTNGQWANGHFVDFDTRLKLTRFFRIAFREHFARSPLDPREYDPAGEVYIVGDTFTRNDAALRAEVRLTDRSRLAFDLGYNFVRWSEDHIASAPQFINYDELSSSVSYERDVSEETVVTGTFSFNNTNSTAPLRPQFDGLSDNQRYAFEVGARTQMSETAGLAFRVGYERSNFRHAPAANDFRGLIFDFLFRRDFSKNTHLELAALRKTQVSAFNLEGGNARLVSTGGSLRIERSQTEALKLGFGVNYQQLGFPVAVVPGSTASGGLNVGAFAGERRTDHLYGFSVDAGYQWSDLLRTRFVYNFSRRDSTIPVITFNRNRLSLIFEFGRRNDVRGRPF